ncbi:MAG TPA: TonB-dependent receptor, partial [Candidatus Acidoferrum sp.]|nr:TonB-dependent receptor [Candidatus Acidoferrum sp.]
MRKTSLKIVIPFIAGLACGLLLLAPQVHPQTLGGITGTVTDTSGGALIGSQVTLVADATKFTRTQKTNSVGLYEFVNLPIGSYTLTISHDGFETQKIPSITVQADRTATVNATLKVGQVGTTVTVEASPLMNSVDTTNGYILEKDQIEAVPLPTGSFTGLAILSPGVNAELSSGTGVNNGLGNQPIWTNGQRDTSNTFLLNGVDASNLFNGKSTSSVSSGRVVNATGLGGAAGVSSTSAAPIQSSSAPYLAIGQALPTPAPETLQEFRVNTSMYDAQQGSTSGAHIDMSTASGTIAYHGSAYIHRGTDALNAAPYFFKADGNIPASDKVPSLHRYTAGGTLGGPVLKDKLFAYIAFQHIHNADQETGSSRAVVPPGLTDTNRTDLNALAAIANNGFSLATPTQAVLGTGSGEINPLAYGLLNYKLPNGQFLIPSTGSYTPTITFPENTYTPGTAYFLANQSVANLDWNASPKDIVALKYYYQHDPTIAPYAYSSAPGFTQHLDAGSQVASITNTQTISPKLSVVEVFGFIREKIFSTIQQPFTPEQFSAYVQSLPAVQAAGLTTAQTSLNTFGSNYFPGFTILDDFGNSALYNTGCPNSGTTCPTVGPVTNGAFLGGIGSSQSQGAFTGVFQNRFMPSANVSWNRGRHTFTFGGSFSYTQLHAADQRTNKGIIGFADFSQFLQGLNTSYTPDGFITSSFLQGDANRYYRSRETGLYLQDKFQMRSNLSITVGLRFDDHGGLTEKYGRLFNFDPALYSYDETSGVVGNNGIIIAANNKLFPTKGVSDSTLTGRQWGLGPRIGLAWSPARFNSKVVVRAGWGMYYDRGELFTYLSPGFASGVIPGGPFGVNQTQPFVANQVCSAIGTFYQGFIPTCDPTSTQGGSFNNPWGATLGPAPSGNPASIHVPNRDAIIGGAPPFVFANYNRGNKLPYTMNQILDIQWQPRSDLMIEVGYVGNLGRHEVIPIPFNQAGIATPTHPIHGQNYTYGYTVQAPVGCNPTLNSGPCSQSCVPFVTCGFLGLPDRTTEIATYENGNVDLRVPFVGLSSQAESYTAAGISAYHGLQTHVEKRLSHGLQVGFSYTFSHATDEQSALGLFYNGNNPLNLRSGYGLSDFDRKHVINFTYLYEIPKFYEASTWRGKLADGWAIQGLAVIQSGQPYSVIDFSGAVGSIFYGTSDGITNPIVPLASDCSPSQALTGHSGATPGLGALRPDCFTIPLLNQGDLNGAIPAGDMYETNFTTGQRNIFRQTWQKRADVSLVKSTQITERVMAKFSFEVFNLTNTTSFDIPINNVSQNLFFNDFPVYGQPARPTSCDSSNQGLYSCPTLSG